MRRDHIRAAQAVQKVVQQGSGVERVDDVRLQIDGDICAGYLRVITFPRHAVELGVRT